MLVARGLDAFFYGFTGIRFLPIEFRILSQFFLITSLIIFPAFIHLENTPTTSTSIHHSKKIKNLS